ncbi:MAG: TIGR01777 family protein [Acidobacteria bacterium]|nr:TIGR01777 family protein [Acidobacteriota bacterium]MBI3425234.1 TIGR01777 family protein [Acidobacteriota bacterium]
MKILITGATGLIGKALSQALVADGHQIVVLTRNPERATGIVGATAYAWQPEHEPPPVAAFEGVTAVIHLAGENVAARWTTERKRRIRDSRVLGTRNLVLGMQQSAVPPSIFIAGSAVGIYGYRGAEQLTEQAAPGTGFLVDLCREWETESEQAQAFGARTVMLRTGVVLSRAGGALKTMLPAFRFGVAGKLGDGRQWFPWIHIADIVGLLRHALLNETVRGPLNGVAPNPVTNAEFTKELAAVLHRPALLPVPKFALELLFGEMAAVLLASQRVVPEAALKAGYQFRFPWLHEALRELLAK